MVVSESTQHKKIKDIISEKLKEWTGASIQEYPSSGHELDVFAVTPAGISIYVEIIWSSSRANFFRDMNMIQASDADVKLVVVSPKILNKTEYQREFEKVAISQRRLNFAMHGSLIDGEKILKESDYLENEFNNIVIPLLNRVKVRGKIVGAEVDFEPPDIPSADEIEEELLSNLFVVEKYPEIIFASPTNVRTTRQAYKILGNKIRDCSFFVKNKKLYTFDNLHVPSTPFLPIIFQEKITEEYISEWFQDSVKRNDIMRLFNKAIRIYCEKRSLYYDKKHYRFICLLREDGSTNSFCWRPDIKFVYRKIAVCKRGKDGNILFCKHYAADLRFMFLDNRIFLKIEPTITFTYDGYEPIRSSKLSSLMSRYLSKQYNDSYLDLVRFWGKFLSKLDALISIPTGNEAIKINSSPTSVSTNIGIKKERGS